jgi:hypothetical protein
MPTCPYCGEDVTKLYSSPTIALVWQESAWTADEADKVSVIACSTCYEEMGPSDLDKLGVPAELR